MAVCSLCVVVDLLLYILFLLLLFFFEHGQTGASRSSRVSANSYEQRTNNARAAYANSYEQRANYERQPLEPTP